MTRIVLITIAHGRHDHWHRQREALALAPVQPDEHILVAIDDPALGGLDTAGRVPPRVIHQPSRGRRLPLAAARNAGATAALAGGGDVLVFLDVDCLPDPDLFRGYRDAATAPSTSDRLLAGPVTYLDPRPVAGYDLNALDALDRPHEARPAPPRGNVELGGSHDLFWSLSFAVHAATWRRIGGFCEDYVGYGAEDTDFAWTARAHGVEMAWIGDARAYHQHHPVEDPPVGHLDDILRNATLFHERWGTWPMGGWLASFEALGLIERTVEGRPVRLL